MIQTIAMFISLASAAVSVTGAVIAVRNYRSIKDENSTWWPK